MTSAIVMRAASTLLRTEMALQKPLTHLLAGAPTRSRARYEAAYLPKPTLPDGGVCGTFR